MDDVFREMVSSGQSRRYASRRRGFDPKVSMACSTRRSLGRGRVRRSFTADLLSLMLYDPIRLEPLFDLFESEGVFLSALGHYC